MVVFISDGRVNILQNNDIRIMECEPAEKYSERSRELRRKREWKQTGSGANFMGISMFTGELNDASELASKLPVTGVSLKDDKIFYSLNFEQGGGMYSSDLKQEEPDTHIFVNTNTRFYELDINSSGIIAVSNTNHYIERHISLYSTAAEHVDNIATDGECCDSNPKWSLKDENVFYYDSAGIAYTSGGVFAGLGPRSIYRLNIKTGELDEVLTGNEFEYVNPFEDENGNLYYIRRPYEQPIRKFSLKDVILAPFRVLRAIGGWLNFFTIRYTGEPLNTNGNNPAKAAQKTEKELFIDGNLVEAEKNLKLNLAAGDKNPGYAPRSWELMVKAPSGEEKVIQKSVISYCVTKDGIVYSNGKYIIAENNAVKAHLAAKLGGL